MSGQAELWHLGTHQNTRFCHLIDLKDILEEREDGTCQLPLLKTVEQEQNNPSWVYTVCLHTQPEGDKRIMSSKISLGHLVKPLTI